MLPDLLLALGAGGLQAPCATWNLWPSPPKKDQNAGLAVAHDRRHLLVGAPARDLQGRMRGVVEVWLRQPGGWVETTELLASDGAALDLFGRALALDGTLAAIGAPGGSWASNPAGAVYLFERAEGSWSELQKLVPPAAEVSDRWGWSLDLDGPALVCGGWSTEVHVFRDAGGTWEHHTALTVPGTTVQHGFGWDVALSGDRLVVGAPSASAGQGSTGLVHVFRRLAGSWQLETTLSASDAVAFAHFGRSVDVDGGRVVVGAPLRDDVGFDSGAVYVFERQGAGWVEVQKIQPADLAGGDSFGASLSLEGDRLAVGATGDDDGGSTTGSAYVYERSGSGFQLVRKLSGVDPGGQLGVSVALSGDRVAAGAASDGTVADGAGAVRVVQLGLDISSACSCAGQGACGDVVAGTGCRNSSGFGGLLVACGSTELSLDELVLEAVDLPAGQLAVLFGGAPHVATPFEAGLLCVGAGLVRVGVSGSSSTGTAGFGPGLFGVGGPFAPGPTRALQVAYRDPSGPCGTWNLTNALLVDFVP